MRRRDQLVAWNQEGPLVVNLNFDGKNTCDRSGWEVSGYADKFYHIFLVSFHIIYSSFTSNLNQLSVVISSSKACGSMSVLVLMKLRYDYEEHK